MAIKISKFITKKYAKMFRDSMNNDLIKWKHDFPRDVTNNSRERHMRWLSPLYRNGNYMFRFSIEKEYEYIFDDYIFTYKYFEITVLIREMNCNIIDTDNIKKDTEFGVFKMRVLWYDFLSYFRINNFLHQLTIKDDVAFKAVMDTEDLLYDDGSSHEEKPDESIRFE